MAAVTSETPMVPEATEPMPPAPPTRDSTEEEPAADTHNLMPTILESAPLGGNITEPTTTEPPEVEDRTLTPTPEALIPSPASLADRKSVV